MLIGENGTNATNHVMEDPKTEQEKSSGMRGMEVRNAKKKT